MKAPANWQELRHAKTLIMQSPSSCRVSHHADPTPCRDPHHTIWPIPGSYPIAVQANPQESLQSAALGWYQPPGSSLWSASTPHCTLNTCKTSQKSSAESTHADWLAFLCTSSFAWNLETRSDPELAHICLCPNAGMCYMHETGQIELLLHAHYAALHVACAYKITGVWHRRQYDVSHMM